VRGDAVNAALLPVAISARRHPELGDRLRAYREQHANQVREQSVPPG
jgi:phosphoribosylcarboxyaminoimidazole (NCAIR) mutase